MQNFDGGPLNSFSPDPQVDLRSKGPPWPVYLAVSLVVVLGLGFLGIHAYQTRQQRKLHVGFMQQFADYEANDVNAFWKCLFGKEGDARRFNSPEGLNNALETQLQLDPKEYPAKAQTECKPKALTAAKRIREFSPPPPMAYETALDTYGRTLSGLANAIDGWAEGAPKRVETMMQEKAVKTAGDAWSGTQNPRKPDPAALKYDKFLRCAVPDLDKIKGGQELLEMLASKCFGKKIDQAFLGKLRDTCIPQAQEAPGKAPANFGATLAKLVEDYDRENQAWDACFREVRKASKKDDLLALDKTWIETVNASTEIRKIGKDNLKDN